MATAIRSHGFGKPGAIFGLKVPDGEALDQLFRDLFAKEVAPEDRARFTFDSDHLEGAKVHRYETSALAREMPRFAPLLGGGPNLIGFSKHAVWLAGGTNGRDTLRVALNDQPGPASILHFEMNAKALAELVSSFSVEGARLDDVLATLTDEHPGRLRLTLEGGAHPRLRGTLDLALFGFGFPPREDPGATWGTAGEPLRACRRKASSRVSRKAREFRWRSRGLKVPGVPSPLPYRVLLQRPVCTIATRHRSLSHRLAKVVGGVTFQHGCRPITRTVTNLVNRHQTWYLWDEVTAGIHLQNHRLAAILCPCMTLKWYHRPPVCPKSRYQEDMQLEECLIRWSESAADASDVDLGWVGNSRTRSDGRPHIRHANRAQYQQGSRAGMSLG